MPINEKTQRYDTPCTYTVKEKSNLNNRMYEEGESVEYDGMPAENLTPTDAEGEARFQEYLESNKARQAAMREQFSDSTVGDAEKFAAALGKELAKHKDETDAKLGQMMDAIAALTKAMTPVAPEAPASPSAGDMA
jgi:hypothetical protein